MTMPTFEPVAFGMLRASRSDIGACDLAQPSPEAAAAYAQGFEDGQQTEAAVRAARTAAALDSLAQSLESFGSALSELQDEMRADAARLALSFARKLAGRLIEVEPVAPVLEAFASLAFDLAQREDVTIHVGPDALPALQAALEASQPAPRIAPILAADPDLTTGDFRIDWPDGGLIRDRNAIEARLEAILDRSLSPQSAPEVPS